jgi:hypothetical protein
VPRLAGEHQGGAKDGEPVQRVEGRERRLTRAQRHEHGLQREQHEDQRGETREPTAHPPHERQDQDDERQPAEGVAPVAMVDERAGPVEDAEAGEEDLQDRAGDECAGDERKR